MFEQFLLAQYAQHPAMQPRDVAKLCYQAAFGAEHLLGDIARVRGYFDSEWAAVPARDGPLAEPIAPDVCRVNLDVWKHRGLPGPWLFALFVVAAQEPRGGEGGEALFWQYIAAGAQLPFAPGVWQAFLDSYKKEGARPVHHSEEYRQHSRPAYRVISGRHVRLIPVLARMTADCVVAIDGRAASGKTTLAADLAHITGAGTVHVDDFFLPAALRTPQRLAMPGGNFHHERLLAEVLPALRSGEAFSYGVFDCQRMDYAAPRPVATSPIRLVEGAYSHHPLLGPYMDLRVFSDIAPDTQMARIEQRNGPNMAHTYATKWIPLEESYLQAFQIKDNAHILV